jgi:hypothetical protein
MRARRGGRSGKESTSKGGFRLVDPKYKYRMGGVKMTRHPGWPKDARKKKKTQPKKYDKDFK